MQANLRAACPKDIQSLFTGIQLLFKIRPRKLAAFAHIYRTNKKKHSLQKEKRKHGIKDTCRLYT